MPASRFGRLQKAAAILPLTLLSAAWTASLAGFGVAAPVVSSASPDGTLPDGTSVPEQAIEAPASVSVPGSIAPGVTGNGARVVATASTNGIPSAALAAYQRAETVINAADKTCNLTWQLIAAIGRVESNHGRANGNALDDKGVARPGIYGVPLDGRSGTSVIRDTDAGKFDRDRKFDRAVGPMQFIPSTWSVVGVDADGDSQRNPQDIDDAALATAVYLCSGDDDLATVSGQRAAVYRYNHSQSYVDLVLSIMDAYLEGDYTSVPNGTTAAGYIVPVPPAPAPGGHHRGTVQPRWQQPAPAEPSDPPEPNDPVRDPDPDPPPPNNRDDDGGGDNVGPVKPPKVDVPDTPDTGIGPVNEVLSYAEAVVQCTADGYVDNPLKDGDAFDLCVEDYTTSGGTRPRVPPLWY